MQFEEIAALASTCRLLREDALHPTSGRFLFFLRCSDMLFLEVPRIAASPLLWAAFTSR